MDPRQGVRSGDPIRLAAEQVNGLNRLLNNRGGFGGPGDVMPSLPYTWVMCRSSIQVDRWKPLAITGLEIEPTTDAKRSSFEDMPLVTGAAPVAETTAWGIAVEPIAQNGIGRLAVAGVVQTLTADLAKIGGYQLLYRSSASAWSLIQIGGGLRLGTIAATWTKGQTATVFERFGDNTAKPTGSTFTAVNYFATITVSSGTRRVACGKVDDKWLLIAAEC